VSPIGTSLQPLQSSYFAPRFEDAKVYDAMRMGLISCPPDTPLREVARMMSTYHIHCVVISEIGSGGEKPWGVIADLDLAAAAAAGSAAERPAGEIARTELVTVSPAETLARAAQLMAEHEVAHLIVVQAENGHPLGVLSTLDVASVLGWGATP
jgi:CBS domain-containing protein